MTIDVDQLRNDMRDECMGAFFGGGFGGALMEAFDAESASPQELAEMAERWGGGFGEIPDRIAGKHFIIGI